MKTVTLFTPMLLNTLRPRAREYVLYDAQCRGLAIRIHPSGAKSWVYWHRVKGKTRRVTLGTFEALTLPEARRAFQRSVADPSQVKLAVPKDTLTFGALASAFMAAKTEVYTKQTLKSLRIYLENQLLPTFGNKPLNRITTPDVAMWFYDYSQRRAGGANQALGHFTTLVNWGKSVQLLPFELPNPASPIRTNRQAARGRLLNTDQLRSLDAALKRATTQQRDAADAIRLILLTGCRSGEILRLRWEEVQKDKLKLARTKTGPRDVNLSNAAIAALEELRLKRRSCFVFPSISDPAKPRTSIAGAWQSLRANAGLPRDIRLHDLRHTYASHAIMSGETLSMTGKLLGHRSVKSTERYAHLDAAFLAKAADKVSRKVEGLLG
jgi:integrase